MTVDTFRVVPVDSVSGSEILDAVEQAFGRPRGEAWYEWKHREGPWGASKGLVAVDEDGVVGVRLLLPWRMRFGREEITALRAVEAASVPRAQGRGVFRMLNRSLMEQVVSGDSATFLFSTPNRFSRGGYRKLGWMPLPPVAHGYHLPLVGWGAADIVSIDEALAGFLAPSALQHRRRIATAWSPAALRWRTDPRSGNRYAASRLRQGATPNGLLYQVMSRRRVRMLSIVYVWGSRTEVRALIGGTARREGALVALATVGRGALEVPAGPSFRRGGSLLMVWAAPDGTRYRGWPIDDLGSWSMSIADLESVL